MRDEMRLCSCTNLLQLIMSTLLLLIFVDYEYRIVRKSFFFSGFRGLSKTETKIKVLPNEELLTASRQLWPDDQFCSRFSVKFGKNLPLNYLISYPRSGNTWLRYLIEGATGVFTGSVYRDDSLYALGYFGERATYNGGDVILVKSHAESLKMRKVEIANESSVVLVIRNPMRSILSYWDLIKGHDHFSEVDRESYNRKGFHNYVAVSIRTWKTMYEKHLKVHDKLLVVFFENVLKHPIKEVKRVVKFLKHPIHDQRIQCLKKYTEGPLKRKHEKRNPFTEAEKHMFLKAIKSILILIKRRGVRDIPSDYKHIQI